jgi:hypothetical protein
MAVSYTWKVTGLKTTTVANTSDVVVQTYWKKIGTDGDLVGEFSGATPFSSNNMPANTSFIPFSDLTENDVLTWIKAVVVDTYENHVNEVIQKQIDEKKNPVVDNSLPWAPVTNSTPVSNTVTSNN